MCEYLRFYKKRFKLLLKIDILKKSYYSYKYKQRNENKTSIYSNLQTVDTFERTFSPLHIKFVIKTKGSYTCGV